MSRMNETKFNIIVREQCELSLRTLTAKGEEYSHEGDRLHNFNQIARINSTTVEKAIWGLASEHLSCVLDMVDGRLAPAPWLLDKKIGALINYLLILKAHFCNENLLHEELLEKENAHNENTSLHSGYSPR